MDEERYSRYKNLTLEEIAPRLTNALGVEVNVVDLARFNEPTGTPNQMIEIAQGSGFFGLTENNAGRLFTIVNQAPTNKDYEGIRSEQLGFGDDTELAELWRWAVANFLYILENPDVPRQLIPID